MATVKVSMNRGWNAGLILMWFKVGSQNWRWKYFSGNRRLNLSGMSTAQKKAVRSLDDNNWHIAVDERGEMKVVVGGD